MCEPQPGAFAFEQFRWPQPRQKAAILLALPNSFKAFVREKGHGGRHARSLRIQTKGCKRLRSRDILILRPRLDVLARSALGTESKSSCFAIQGKKALASIGASDYNAPRRCGLSLHNSPFVFAAAAFQPHPFSGSKIQDFSCPSVEPVFSDRWQRIFRECFLS